MRRLVALFLLISGPAILFLTGCKAKPPESHYPIQAEVIAMDLPRRLLIVQHGDIPGFMPAMTMSYSIAVPKEAEALGEGDKISADLVVSEGKARLEKIVLLEKAKAATAVSPESSPRK
jgi:Cu/Ag efflux protein CusF